jgi:hypothetical protein
MEEFILVGLPVIGVHSSGRIDFKKEATEAQKIQALNILANHKPTWYVEERRKRYPPLGDQLDAIYKWAISNNHVIPGFTDVITKIKTDWPKE